MGETIFIYWLAFIFIRRWVAWGFVISKHGEDKKSEKYNAFTHLLSTLHWGLVLYFITT